METAQLAPNQGEEQYQYDQALRQAAGEAALYVSVAEGAEQFLADNDAIRAEADQYLAAQPLVKPRITSGTNVGFARVVGKAADGGNLQLTNMTNADKEAYVASNKAAFAQQEQQKLAHRNELEYHYRKHTDEDDKETVDA